MHKKIKHVLVVLLFGCLLEVLAEARLMPNAALTLVPFLFMIIFIISILDLRLKYIPQNRLAWNIEGTLFSWVRRTSLEVDRDPT